MILYMYKTSLIFIYIKSGREKYREVESNSNQLLEHISLNTQQNNHKPHACTYEYCAAMSHLLHVQLSHSN